jgi:hypothetical protein
MTIAPTTMTFSPKERDFIRRELDMFFSSYPTVAEGIQLRIWRSGQRAGEPKIPPVVQAMLDRRLLRLDLTGRMPTLFFSQAGLNELRVMMADRRLADTAKFAHIRQELGLSN